jgi:DNA-binding transcriptional LysR family regulator
MAWLPDWLIRDRLGAGTLVPVLTDVSALSSDIHLVWPETHHLPTRVRVAIDLLVVEVPRLGEA